MTPTDETTQAADQCCYMATFMNLITTVNVEHKITPKRTYYTDNDTDAVSKSMKRMNTSG